MIKMSVCSPFPYHMQPRFLRGMGLNSKKTLIICAFVLGCPMFCPGGGDSWTLYPCGLLGVVRVVRVEINLSHMRARAHTYEGSTIHLLNKKHPDHPDHHYQTFCLCGFSCPALPGTAAGHPGQLENVTGPSGAAQMRAASLARFERGKIFTGL